VIRLAFQTAILFASAARFSRRKELFSAVQTVVIILDIVFLIETSSATFITKPFVSANLFPSQPERGTTLLAISIFYYPNR
jgi:hypothetical protein